ncbi:MAG TPA: cupredoxin domain-containing protein [Microthrixaceae bacterium]|nr:cupredoxin domain-containing protein [Microthrixaceae bacterium]
MMLPRPVLVLAAVTVGALGLAACADDDTTDAGGSSDARAVQIDMVDTAFEPDHLAVTEGETIRFVFTNTGAVAHDAFIGDANAQADHEEEMRSDMAGMHGGDADAITVEPGDTGELAYTFDGTGSIEIGCHQQGHYEAGMKMPVDVA